MAFSYKDYPDDWLTVIRPRILDRDGHCCVWCGRANGSYLPKSCCKNPDYDQKERCRSCFKLRPRVVLTIAHLDHDITNNDDKNLRSGCRGCHVSYDAKYHAKNARITLAKKKAKREALACA